MDFEIYGVGAVALIMALVQFAKMVGVPTKLSPLLSVVLGIVLGFVAFGVVDPVRSIVMGLVAGLSAVGIWSGVKNVVQEVKKE